MKKLILVGGKFFKVRMAAEVASRAVDDFAAQCKPESFIGTNEQLSEGAKTAAKALFDECASILTADGSAADTAALPELYTQGFDPEQIWMQVGSGLDGLHR